VTALAAGASLASQAEPGVLGFTIVAGIGLALFFLMRSMNKQLRKVSADRQYFSGPANFPERPGADPAVTPELQNGSTGPEAPAP
jgi:hypothetical protein